MEQGKIIPFYMAYPMPLYYEDEKEVIKDMEYLQSQYSPEIRGLQKEILEMIRIMDYEGSMIYDEYPDRFLMEQRSKTISDQIKRKQQHNDKCIYKEMLTWDGFEDIVRLLVYEEILKRRHQRNKRQLRF